MTGTHCAAVAAGAFPLLLGCVEQHFRAETEWHPDGRVERAIFQPTDFFPEDGRNGWTVVRPTRDVPSDEFTGPIRDLPPSAAEPQYFAAWGEFRSPHDLPDHVRFDSEIPGKAGRLERTVAVNRLGLVTEYVWRERLTDVTSLVDMQDARREVVALVSDLVERTLRDGTLKHDISGLLRWLRTEAAAWLDETHAVIVESAIRHGAEESAGVALAGRLADVAAKYGLSVRTSDGKLIEGNDFDDAIDRFLVVKVRETVRTPEGAPIDEAAARQLLEKLGLRWDGSSLSWQPSDDWRRVVTARFGGEEAAEEKAAELATRLFGAYQAGVLTQRRPFRYDMTLPGSVVETTGERLAENRVAWRFDAAAAFPLGYDMTARSLAPDEAAQKAILGDVRLRSLERLADYASLVDADAALADVLTRSVAAGSRKPFDDYAVEVSTQSGTDPASRARLNRMRKLLDP